MAQLTTQRIDDFYQTLYHVIYPDIELSAEETLSAEKQVYRQYLGLLNEVKQAISELESQKTALIGTSSMEKLADWGRWFSRKTSGNAEMAQLEQQLKEQNDFRSQLEGYRFEHSQISKLMEYIPRFTEEELATEDALEHDVQSDISEDLEEGGLEKPSPISSHSSSPTGSEKVLLVADGVEDITEELNLSAQGVELTFAHTPSASPISTLHTAASNSPFSPTNSKQGSPILGEMQDITAEPGVLVQGVDLATDKGSTADKLDLTNSHTVNSPCSPLSPASLVETKAANPSPNLAESTFEEAESSYAESSDDDSSLVSSSGATVASSVRNIDDLEQEPQLIVQALEKELLRLQHKADTSEGWSYNRLWHANYQAKADKVERAMDDLKAEHGGILTDSMVRSAIYDKQSALYTALNTHTGHVFGGVLGGVTLTSPGYGIVSSEARALLNIKSIIEAADVIIDTEIQALI